MFRWADVLAESPFVAGRIDCAAARAKGTLRAATTLRQNQKGGIRVATSTSITRRPRSARRGTTVVAADGGRCNFRVPGGDDRGAPLPGGFRNGRGAGGEDLGAALHYLAGEPGVDSDRLAVLGICMGASHVLPVAATDSLVKAVATVAGHGSLAVTQRSRSTRALARPSMSRPSTSAAATWACPASWCGAGTRSGQTGGSGRTATQ